MNNMSRKAISLLAVCLLLALSAYGGAAYLRKNRRPAGALAGEGRKVSLKPVLSEEGAVFFDVAGLKNGQTFVVGLNSKDSKLVYSSEDGGRHWTSRTLPTEGFVMQGLSFAEDKYGWIVGDAGLVMHTEDAGQQWTKLKAVTEYELSRVDFVTPRVGYAGGGAERGCQIFRTSDGGQSWRKVYENLEGGAIFDLVALNENVALVTVNGTLLLRTEDGGETWQEIGPVSQGATAVTFTPDGVGWVVGEKGCFYYSSDQGRTWQRPAHMADGLLQRGWNSVAFADAKRGMAVGNQGAAAVTYDGGATWSEVETGVTEGLNRIVFDDKDGLILGSHKIYQLTTR
jgi:photosystem II stability/assembly factor-like uncharacterized protein